MDCVVDSSLKKYFNEMFNDIDENIKLDDDQINAIMADDKYVLVIAGAGTGKTTTIAAKVKYLVDIKGVDPSKILVMSYTKKATMELEKRIVNDFDIPAHVTTFHSLGYRYIRKIFNNKKCVVIDENKKNEIFLKFFKMIFDNKDNMNEVLELFSNVGLNKKYIFGRFFKDNYSVYKTYDDFFNAYKNEKITEAKRVGLHNVIDDWVNRNITREYIQTISGDFVKSVSEAVIANFLYKHGIEYKYEKVYSELMDDRMVYRPDFTLELYGENIYLEYFGLNDNKYNKLKKKKIDYHKLNNNKCIFIDNVPLNLLEVVLDAELKKNGFVYKDRSNEEIYNRILDNNPLSQIFNFKNLLYSCVNFIKESLKREDYYNIVMNYINNLIGLEKEQSIRQFYYIDLFYRFYQNELYGADIYYFDYADLLYYSNKYLTSLNSDDDFDIKYVIIDEYQDISNSKYELAKRVVEKNNASIFAVGDDWQSIYSFNGSEIGYIYNFSNYFNNAKLYTINKTYRNSQELIDSSGDFIMKNKSQIRKFLISNKHLNDPIKFIYYDSDTIYSDYHGVRYDGYLEYQCLKKTILEIHRENPSHNILILGRTNEIIDKCFMDSELKDDINTKITFIGYEDIELDGMTIHKAKGLTYDEVIIIGLNNKYPSREHYSFWFEKLFKNEVPKEGIMFPEERRIFYVALTRTKNHVYLITDKNKAKRSIFVNELEDIINSRDDIEFLV